MILAGVFRLFFKNDSGFYRSAGSAADHRFLQDLLLIDLAVQKLVLYIIKSQSLNGICKTLAGNSLVAEEKNRAFYQIDHFLLCCKNLIQRLAFCNLFAPAAADIYLVSGQRFIDCAKGTSADTASAVVAAVLRNLDPAVCNLRHFDRTVVLYLALLASFALGKIDLRYALPDDTDIVQIRFYAVIRAAAHSDFKFMGQVYAVISDII